MRIWTRHFSILLLSLPLPAQRVITSAAGTDVLFPPSPIAAFDAPLGEVIGVSAAPDGSYYFCDRQNHIVVRLADDGMLQVVAGNGLQGFSGDGEMGTNASLSGPTSVAVDTAGRIYIADRGNQRVRVVDESGVIRTLVTVAQPLSGVTNLALGPGGQLYAADSRSGTVVVIDASGVIRPFVSGLRFPAQIAVDAEGSVYVAELRAQRIVKVSPSGSITPIAGNGQQGFSDGVTALAAQLNNPSGVAVDEQGRVWIADLGNHRLRRVERDGTIHTVGGSGDFNLLQTDGPALETGLPYPTTVATARGQALITGSANLGIRRLIEGRLTRAAGNGRFSSGGDGGAASSATLGESTGLAVTAQGLFFTERNTNRIRRITPAGMIDTVAGTGDTGYSGDGGPARLARLAGPVGLGADALGNLYFADSRNAAIRRILTDGRIETVLRDDRLRVRILIELDDALTAARGLVFYPFTVDPSGNCYVTLGSSLVRVTPAGAVETIVPAFRTDLFALAWDPTGSGSILGGGSFGVVVRVSLSGEVTLLPTAERLPTINCLFVDRQGNVLFCAQRSQIGQLLPDGRVPLVAGHGRFQLDTPNLVFSTGIEGPAKLFGDPRRLIVDGDGRFAQEAGIVADAITIDAAMNLYMIGGGRIRVLPATRPPARVTPASLLFSGRSGEATAAEQRLSFASIPGLAFRVEVQPAEAASWLKTSVVAAEAPRQIGVTANPEALAPGEYAARIVFRAPNSATPELTAAVRFVVDPGRGPTLDIGRSSILFQFARSVASRTEVLTVRNAGGGSLPVRLSARTASGGNWLRVSPTTGTATPSAPLVATVTADPTGLTQGTYTGEVRVDAEMESRVVPITMTISDRDSALRLTQTGLSFAVVRNGGLVPPQTFGVSNPGTGTVRWQASPSTTMGGNWLRVTPAVGTTIAGGVVPTAGVAVSPEGLEPGSYFGLASVTAADAANSPQSVTVFLQVLPPDGNPGAAIQPAQLSFQTRAGINPGSQELLLYNPISTALAYRTSVAVGTPTSTLRVAPADGTVDPSRPSRVVVQPLAGGLGAGENRGTITFQFSDGSVAEVPVVIAVTAPSPPTSARAAAVEGCVPAKLVPSIRSLGQSQSTPVGWPAALDVEVRDDCGAALDAGSVTASFSNGDAPVSLQSLRAGRWQGTWNAAKRITDQVQVRIEARTEDGALAGATDSAALLRSSQDPPRFEGEGVVSATIPVPFQPLAPGSLITIFGERLATRQEEAAGFPLPTRLGGTSVVMAGQALSLLYAGENQINAIVPAGVAFNTNQQMIIRRDNALSRPVELAVAAAQPGVFQAGGSAIAIVARLENGAQRQFVVTPAARARVGDTITLLCAGLGPTNPSVPDGVASPSTPPAVARNQVRVLIGGIESAVSFAGLTPGFSGLYQVNVVIPQVATGRTTVPVVLETVGQRSAEAQLPIE